MSLIGIVSDPAKGGTFLDWSIHYLAGHSRHYSAVKGNNTWQTLTDSPLTKTNSHGFISNQTSNLEKFNDTYNILNSVSCDEFHTIYFHNWNGTSVDIDCKQAINTLQSNSNKLIFLKNHAILYDCKYNQRVLTEKRSSPGNFNKNFDEQHNDFIDYFFQHDKTDWQQQGLTNTWDYREFLALNLRPFETITIEPNIDLTKEHYYIDSKDLWIYFDLTVKDLFKYLNLEIQEQRYLSWSSIYLQWKELHRDRLQFDFYFKQIIDYILKGHSMDLERFNLDIVQEAAIQHELIYNHSLNLKTWQLEKFINTQQLHSLLESNSHKI